MNVATNCVDRSILTGCNAMMSEPLPLAIAFGAEQGWTGSGVLVLEAGHKIIASDRRNGKLTVLSVDDGRVLGTVATGPGPDSVSFDPMRVWLQ